MCSTTAFGIPGVAEHTFPLKTLPDATRLCNHLLSVWEDADAGAGVDAQAALTVLLVGGGPTGVELAGAICELMAVNVARDYRNLDASQARRGPGREDRSSPGWVCGAAEQEALRTLRASSSAGLTTI